MEFISEAGERKGRRERREAEDRPQNFEDAPGRGRASGSLAVPLQRLKSFPLLNLPQTLRGESSQGDPVASGLKVTVPFCSLSQPQARVAVARGSEVVQEGSRQAGMEGQGGVSRPVIQDAAPDLPSLGPPRPTPRAWRGPGCSLTRRPRRRLFPWRCSVAAHVQIPRLGSVADLGLGRRNKKNCDLAGHLARRGRDLRPSWEERLRRTEEKAAGGLRAQSAGLRLAGGWRAGSAQLLLASLLGRESRGAAGRAGGQQGKPFSTHHRRPATCPVVEPQFREQSSRVCLAGAEDCPTIQAKNASGSVG